MTDSSQNIDRIARNATPLLPRYAAGDRPLLFVLTLMAFLAGLIFLVTLMSVRATQDWRSDLQNTATVQLYLDSPLSNDPARRESIATAQTILASFPGVKSSTVLSDEKARERLQPWLGSVDLPDDLPFPVIVSVETKGDGSLSSQALLSALETAGLSAEVDLHTAWKKNIEANARAISGAFSALFFCVFLGGIATSIFATHSRIETHHKIIKVLNQVGAKPLFIARLFTVRFLIKGLLAGALGCILALMFVVLFQLLSVFSEESLFRAFTVSFQDIVALGGVALLFAGACGLSACFTCLTLLRTENRRR